MPVKERGPVNSTYRLSEWCHGAVTSLLDLGTGKLLHLSCVFLFSIAQKKIPKASSWDQVGTGVSVRPWIQSQRSL